MPKPEASAQERPLADRFPDVLKELRQGKRLSQEELAERANLHRTYISLIERGMSVPSLNTLEQIAAALSMSMSAVIQRLEEHEQGA